MRRCLTLLLILFSSAACALDAVNLQLKWKHQFQFAGYYAALEKGYYREAGLDVKLAEARPDSDVVAEVVAGRAQFGVGTSDLILARQKNPVVLLAVIFQHSPLILLTRGDRLSNLHELATQALMIEPQSAELLAYLKSEGVDLQKLKLVAHTFNPQDLIEGRVAAMSAYSTTEPFVLHEARIPMTEFSPRASGIDFYGDNLFTSESEVRSHPSRVRAFREASLRGWQYAMAHPDELIELILARYNTQNLSRAQLKFEAAEMERLIQPQLVELGYVNPGRWNQIAQTYANLQFVTTTPVLDGFIYTEETSDVPKWLLTVGIGGGLLVTVFGLLAALSVGLSRRLQREVSKHKEALQLLGESEQHFRLLAENMHDVIWVMELDSGRFSYVSPSVERLRGYTVAEVMAHDVSAALTPESAVKVRNQIAETIARVQGGDLSARNAVTEVQQPHRDGHIIDTEVVTNLLLDDSGKPLRIIGVTRDITERKHAEAAEHAASLKLQQQFAEITELQIRLQEQAIRDPLTGLYNRRYLDETLPRELSRAKREGYPLSLIMVDLDHFKQVNDTYGHPAGDTVLRALAEILRHGAREGDVPCRYGGEEFIVALPRMPLAMALERADHWRAAIADLCIRHGELEVRVTLSAGIATFPEHGGDFDTLLKCADLALYAAKHQGRNQVLPYDSILAPTS